MTKVKNVSDKLICIEGKSVLPLDEIEVKSVTPAIMCLKEMGILTLEESKPNKKEVVEDNSAEIAIAEHSEPVTKKRKKTTE